jgi:hypothetical protein
LYLASVPVLITTPPCPATYSGRPSPGPTSKPRGRPLHGWCTEYSISGVCLVRSTSTAVHTVLYPLSSERGDVCFPTKSSILRTRSCTLHRRIIGDAKNRVTSRRAVGPTVLAAVHELKCLRRQCRIRDRRRQTASTRRLVLGLRDPFAIH